ncbi:hypothetical protein [Catellatospora bangladeshensis]
MGGQAGFGALSAFVGNRGGDAQGSGRFRQWVSVEAGRGDQFHVEGGQAVAVGAHLRGGLLQGLTCRIGQVGWRRGWVLGLGRGGPRQVRGQAVARVGGGRVEQPAGNVGGGRVDDGQAPQEAVGEVGVEVGARDDVVRADFRPPAHEAGQCKPERDQPELCSRCGIAGGEDDARPDPVAFVEAGVGVEQVSAEVYRSHGPVRKAEAEDACRDGEGQGVEDAPNQSSSGPSRTNTGSTAVICSILVAQVSIT